MPTDRLTYIRMPSILSKPWHTGASPYASEQEIRESRSPSARRLRPRLNRRPSSERRKPGASEAQDIRAAELGDYELVNIIVDAGASAKNLRREGADTLLELVKARKGLLFAARSWDTTV